MSTHLVIGFKGEVGSAVCSLLLKTDHTKIAGKDKGQDVWMNGFDGQDAEYMHVCIPWDDKFKLVVAEYASVYGPEIVIIHSTVPVGITRQLCEDLLRPCVHSPVRGKHPDLLDGLKTFVKTIGTSNARAGGRVKDLFESMGLKTRLYDKSETTELAKLLCTTTYGLYLSWAQEQARMCEKLNLNYKEVAIEFAQDYNEGYQRLGHPEFTKPILTPGYIGGHCVMPNIDLLEQTFPSDFCNLIKQSNLQKYVDEYAREQK